MAAFFSWQSLGFPPPPDKDLFGHLLRAQQRLALRRGRGVSQRGGVNRGQQWLGITFQEKKAEPPPPPSDIPPPTFPWLRRGERLCGRTEWLCVGLFDGCWISKKEHRSVCVIVVVVMVWLGVTNVQQTRLVFIVTNYRGANHQDTSLGWGWRAGSMQQRTSLAPLWACAQTRATCWNVAVPSFLWRSLVLPSCAAAE